jgi:choline kinase
MQAIIMAAGKGTRLAPLTDNIPKCFVEINGKKLLDYQIELYERYNINEIIIVTGYKSDLIEEHVKNKKHIKTVYNPFYESTNVLPSFWVGMNYLNDNFIYSHADTIFDIPILEKILDTKGSIVLPVDVKNCGKEEMKISVDNSGSINFINKSMTGKEALGEFLGVAKISKETLPVLKETVEKIMKKKEFQSFFEVALQDLVYLDRNRFKLVDVSGLYWNEIDFVEDYNYALNNFQKSSLK